MTSLSTSDLISDQQMQVYTDLIYSRTGIRIPLMKKTLLSNRIRRRLRKTGVDNFGDYFRLLQSLPQSDPEWDAFLQEITTHETYLFRDDIQWKWFRQTYLKDLMAAVRANKRPRKLRVWSAAASTGDEAYTIASCVSDSLTGHGAWQVNILGTDIGIGAVEQAKSGVFGERAMKHVPDGFRKRYFTKVKDANVWKAKPVLDEMVSFQVHNLMEPIRQTPFDLVFIKNVLIYFDKSSKKKVIENVQKVIPRGGVLVLGPTEGAAQYLDAFQRIQPWLFMRI